MAPGEGIRQKSFYFKIVLFKKKREFYFHIGQKKGRKSISFYFQLWPFQLDEKVIKLFLIQFLL
jgi:hypothetical protein